MKRSEWMSDEGYASGVRAAKQPDTKSSKKGDKPAAEVKSGISEELSAALDEQEARAGRLGKLGALSFAVGGGVLLTWLLLGFGINAAAPSSVLTSIDVPASIAGLIPKVGGVVSSAPVTVDPAFQQMTEVLTGWTNGALGKALALSAFLFGAAFGIAKQSIMPAVMGIVFALTFSTGPRIITEMLNAQPPMAQVASVPAESIVSIFERTKELGPFERALPASLPEGARGYIVGQAVLLLPDAKKGDELPRLRGLVDSAEQAVASGQLNGVSKETMYVLEKHAYGKAVSTQAMELEAGLDGPRKLHGFSMGWFVVAGLAMGFGVLVQLVSLTVRKRSNDVRAVMTAKMDIDGPDPNEVPDFTDAAHGGVEAMLQMSQGTQKVAKKA